MYRTIALYFLITAVAGIVWDLKERHWDTHTTRKPLSDHELLLTLLGFYEGTAASFQPPLVSPTPMDDAHTPTDWSFAGFIVILVVLSAIVFISAFKYFTGRRNADSTPSVWEKVKQNFFYWLLQQLIFAFTRRHPLTKPTAASSATGISASVALTHTARATFVFLLVYFSFV